MKSDAVIDAILKREGGFVDHPDDRGGATKYSITQDTLRLWRKDAVSVEDVRQLSKTEARAIYQSLYIEQPHFDRIKHPELRALIVDSGVNHGPSRASRWLQQAAGVSVDGLVGPVTLKAVNDLDGERLYRQVLAERCRFYGRLISGQPSQAVFAAGWMSRLSEFIEATP